jgi:hypothetical protein
MTIIDIIQNWCDSTIAKIVVEYDKQGRRASGGFERDLESNIEETGKGYKVQILGSNYSYWMENGRRAGKFPPIDAIKQWIDDKGVIANDISKNSLAFLIARKIANEGYQGKPVIEPVINKKWIDQLMKEVGLFTVSEIKSDVLKNFKSTT